MRTTSCLIGALIGVGSIYAGPPIASHDAKIEDVQLHYLTAVMVQQRRLSASVQEQYRLILLKNFVRIKSIIPAAARPV
jgi:hypothetical protein